MDHAEALERIEIAAAEPDGIERLMAGDTPDAAAVAGHLAGCPACVDELARIRSVSGTVREILRAQPDPALRERTLAFVRAVGRDRSAGAAESRTPEAAVATLPPPAPAADSAPAGPMVGHAGTVRPFPVAAAPAPAAVRIAASGRLRLGWAAGIAAALVVAGVLGYAAGGGGAPAAPGDLRAEVGVLQEATTAAMRVAAQPDARHVTLAAASGSATGSLVFSPASGELVVVATDLAPTAAGQEYGCWVEANGTRRRLGRMYWAGDLWAWAGPASGLADLPPDAVFGVSLGPVGGGGSAEPVLTGGL